MGGSDKWNILDRWFVFLAGQIKDRAFLRWLYARRRLIYEVWFWAALVCSLFNLLVVFSPDKMGDVGFIRLTFHLLTFDFFGGRIGDVSLVIACLVLGAIMPVVIALFPVALILLPLFMVGAALWVVVFFVTLIVAALAPLGVLFGGRAIFEHYIARWLAEAGQREAERAAVYAALGLDGGASRTVSGGAAGIMQHHARPMTDEEAAAFEQPSPSALLLGRAYGRPFWVDTPKHTFIAAGTRGGKGRDLIVPNLKIYKGGVFVLDPKGENAQKTAANRAEFGDVFALDPFGVSGLPSASFNPLAKMAGDSMIAEAQTLADALIIGDANEYFASAGRQLLAGVILHVVTAENITKRDLPTVRRLLMQELPETLATMAESEDETAGDVLRDVGAWGLSTAEDEWSGIRNSAIIALDWLASPQMAAVVSDKGAGLDFSDYLEKSMTVYVCLPAPKFAKYNRWLRLVVASALDAMTARLAPPPLPVRFILDEVAQLGNLSSIESALTLSAGYGVQLWGIWQHVGDVQRCYPSSGISGWVSSSGVRMCFANNDNDTCAEFSKQAGGVFTPDQIARLSSSDMLVLLDGQNPAIIQRDALNMV